MGVSKRLSIGGWLLVGLGMVLCLLPLYADLFTVKILDTDNETFENGPLAPPDLEYSAGFIAAQTMEKMHVPGWWSAVGGTLVLCGGYLIGRSRGRERPGSASE